MRWEQGQWSEERIEGSINASDGFRAVPYGRSQIGPTDKAEIPEYWERFTAVESVGKRPDLLVLAKSDFEKLKPLIDSLGDLTLRDDAQLQPLLDAALCAVEAENSLWVGDRMPDYGRAKITRLNFVAPTLIVKEEDAPRLKAWQDHHNVPVCIIHVFFDRGYIATLDQILETVALIRQAEKQHGVVTARQLQKENGVIIKAQNYADSRTGSSTTKTIYRMHHTRAIEFGVVDPSDPPSAEPNVLYEDNGRIMAYVRFRGGTLILSRDGIDFLNTLAGV